MKKFYQSRKSQRTVSVGVMGSKIPLYGSGASLSSTTGMPTVPVPLKLNFVIRSRANVLGKLVKPKYYKRIQCSVNLDPKKINVSVSLKNSCTYDWGVEWNGRKKKHVEMSIENECQLIGQLWMDERVFLCAPPSWKDRVGFGGNVWVVGITTIFTFCFITLIN